jgi:hypothetical protein
MVYKVCRKKNLYPLEKKRLLTWYKKTLQEATKENQNHRKKNPHRTFLYESVIDMAEGEEDYQLFFQRQIRWTSHDCVVLLRFLFSYLHRSSAYHTFNGLHVYFFLTQQHKRNRLCTMGHPFIRDKTRAYLASLKKHTQIRPRMLTSEVVVVVEAVEAK